MNMRANFYQGYSNNSHSDIAIFSFGNLGTYKDYTLTNTDETYAPYSSSNYPFLIELSFYKNVSVGMVWGCNIIVKRTQIGLSQTARLQTSTTKIKQ
ncbi:unnamed protein product [Blepharisma stoltei]|uniref:Uncharacterized protein n=1 Tax=Blepharisma stoltei TaxID=1481888 RepID=A0AAU9J5U7_9CILI|nr:unnamed protein product [Blepharisma stoltei]